MTQLTENMFIYYKKADYSCQPPQFNIPINDFLQKMVIFGISPDEKSILHAATIQSTHFKRHNCSFVDLPLFKSIFLNHLGLRYVKLLMTLLKQHIKPFYDSLHGEVV